MTEQKTKIERTARLKWIPIEKMKVNPLAQRSFRRAWADRLAAEFDPEQLGIPTVNERDGSYYICDGQHRLAMLREIGWGDQQIQCWTYVGLSEDEEAETFLKLQNRLRVDAFSQFRVAVAAGRPVEQDVDRIVRAQGLRVSREKVDGAVGAVTALTKVYKRNDGVVLGRTLRIIRDAYGDGAFTAPVIDGLGHLCARYNGQLDEETAIERLSTARAGMNGLLGRAETIHRATGNGKALCIAAAAVEIINRGRSGTKLPNWWS